MAVRGLIYVYRLGLTVEKTDASKVSQISVRCFVSKSSVNGTTFLKLFVTWEQSCLRYYIRCIHLSQR